MSLGIIGPHMMAKPDHWVYWEGSARLTDDYNISYAEQLSLAAGPGYVISTYTHNYELADLPPTAVGKWYWQNPNLDNNWVQVVGKTRDECLMKLFFELGRLVEHHEKMEATLGRQLL